MAVRGGRLKRIAVVPQIHYIQDLEGKIFELEAGTGWRVRMLMDEYRSELWEGSWE